MLRSGYHSQVQSEDREAVWFPYQAMKACAGLFTEHSSCGMTLDKQVHMPSEQHKTLFKREVVLTDAANHTSETDNTDNFTLASITIGSE